MLVRRYISLNASDVNTDCGRYRHPATAREQARCRPLKILPLFICSSFILKPKDRNYDTFGFNTHDEAYFVCKGELMLFRGVGWSHMVGGWSAF